MNVFSMSLWFNNAQKTTPQRRRERREIPPLCISVVACVETQREGSVIQKTDCWKPDSNLWCGDAFFDVSLPGFVVSNPAFCLFACKFHFLGYVIDPGSSIFLLVKAVAWRPEIDFIGVRPFCFYFICCLDAPSLWHAKGSLQEVLPGDSTSRLLPPQPSK